MLLGSLVSTSVTGNTGGLSCLSRIYVGLVGSELSSQTQWPCPQSLLLDFFFFFETESHYVALAGPELRTVPVTVVGLQGWVTISSFAVELIFH